MNHFTGQDWAQQPRRGRRHDEANGEDSSQTYPYSTLAAANPPQYSGAYSAATGAANDYSVSSANYNQSQYGTYSYPLHHGHVATTEYTTSPYPSGTIASTTYYANHGPWTATTGQPPGIMISPSETPVYPHYGSQDPGRLSSHSPSPASSPGDDSSGKGDKKHFCTYNNICARSFARKADLHRHVITVHEKNLHKKYPCKFKRCDRKGDRAFTRKDHLTEHERNYHKKDVPKRPTRQVDDDEEELDEETQQPQHQQHPYYQSQVPYANSSGYTQYQ